MNTQGTKSQPSDKAATKPAEKREVWRCCACGRITAIGDRPVSRGCKCI